MIDENGENLGVMYTREAFEQVLAGEPLQRREDKRPYNGAVGVPIREEIIARDGESVITRNSYGALCLNTPDVLFADVDLEQRPSGCALPVGVVVVLALAGFAAGFAAWQWPLGLALAVATVDVQGAALLPRAAHAEAVADRHQSPHPPVGGGVVGGTGDAAGAVGMDRELRREIAGACRLPPCSDRSSAGSHHFSLSPCSTAAADLRRRRGGRPRLGRC